MLKDITLGQYFPGESLIHVLDARVKLMLTFAFMIIIFIANSIINYTILGILLLSAIIISKISPKTFIKSLKPLMLFIMFALVFNALLTPGQVLAKWWIFTVTKEGLVFALLSLCRITYMVLISALLTYTTSPSMMTNAIEKLLKPLAIFKFPSHEVAMMMTIALRYIPILIDETDKIIKAQSARCADFESGNIFRRAKALIPLLIPLFVSVFRRADELAIAMESRCYRGGEGRTSLYQPRIHRLDYAATLLVLAVGIITIIL